MPAGTTAKVKHRFVFFKIEDLADECGLFFGFLNISVVVDEKVFLTEPVFEPFPNVFRFCVTA